MSAEPLNNLSSELTYRVREVRTQPDERRSSNGDQSVQESAFDYPLAAAAAAVEHLLPWRSEVDGRPRGMRVVETGFLEWSHALFPAGVPYVAVGVDSWDGAWAVRIALQDVARLDDAAWDLDWESSDAAFRVIRVFPDLEDLPKAQEM